ncbi:YecR-like lipofamily protein [Roseovarius sp. PS-C2]|uniref:YecR family lipoprotein n=1 Tax=Roseovarius sp. PS-C2 TaxID=2820814 RepID=UPI001C0B199B|nr:YecR family lipoprotein [Roseovarius sp. PS-C2]MBU3261161.1 YecR-like lipofamily protein [Roseovarius sp. PS-C2]
MKISPFFAVSALFLSACMAPPPVSMQAAGGSRSAGLIEMSTTYNPQIEEISWTASGNEASNRCRAWGFEHALPFKNISTSCLAFDDYYGTCKSMKATRTYQCAVR